MRREPVLAQPSDNLHVQPTEELEWGQLSLPGLDQTYHDTYPRGSQAQPLCI